MTERDMIEATNRLRSGALFGGIFAVVGLTAPYALAGCSIGALLGFAIGWRLALPGSDLIKPGRRGRARAGLWLGAGSAALLLLLVAVMRLADVAPDGPTWARATLAIAMVIVLFCHLFSFGEMVGSLRAATRSPGSPAAVGLLAYWVVVPATMSVMAWTMR